MILTFAFSANDAKELLKMFDIPAWFVNVQPLKDNHLGKSDDVFLMVITDLIPFQVYLILFILASKYLF